MDSNELRLMAFTVAVIIITTVAALPGAQRRHHGRRHDEDATDDDSIVGVASNILAVDVLRAKSATHANFVFSPLGFSSILAILSEGARGETARRITTALRHPSDAVKVRAAYRTALGRLQGDSALLAPQFKTWMYVYRNNSVLDAFRQTLRTDYHVEVKDIDRYDDDRVISDSSPSSEAALSFDSDLFTAASNEAIDTMPVAVAVTVNSTIANADPDANSKDIVEFDALKVTHAGGEDIGAHPDDETRLIDDQQDASKFDEVVEDKQYVEVPQIRKEIAAAIGLQQQQVNTRQQLVEQVKQQAVPKKAEVHSEKMPAQSSDSHFVRVAREFGGQSTGSEVASVLSGNSIVGRKAHAAADANRPDEYESKLILFNGLYYRGSWAAPFQQLRSASEASSSVFYKSDTDKCAVHMMRARGQFRYARLKEAAAQAIELPYDNARYALLIILPNSRSGLGRLQSDYLGIRSIQQATAQLTAQSIDLSLPKFSVDTTGGIEQVLASSVGDLSDMFTERADFGGITDEQRLHVGELQQHVSVRIDEGASSENALTAGNALRSATATTEAAGGDHVDAGKSGEPMTLVVDRPFLFFVRDVIDNVLIVAGKMVEPPSKDDDEPIALE